MSTFTVSISRSAAETAELRVEASSQEEAEAMIHNTLNVCDRVSLGKLASMQGVKVAYVECFPDDESSWEVN